MHIHADICYLISCIQSDIKRPSISGGLRLFWNLTRHRLILIFTNLALNYKYYIILHVLLFYVIIAKYKNYRKLRGEIWREILI